MNIKPIRNDNDYEAILKEVAALMKGDPEMATLEGDHLNVLATLVQA